MIAWYAMVGLIGLALGSFLNVVIYRLPRRMSLLGPRSKCPGCDTQIRAWDNIPVLSFMLLKRRCRHCERPISWRYPLVELLTPALLVAVALKFGWGVDFVKYGMLVLLLIPITFIDWNEQIIPNRLTLTGFVSGLVITLVFQFEMWRFILLGAGFGLLLPLFFAALAKLLFRKDALGMGDVKLLVMSGVYVGYRGVAFSLFFAAVLGLCYLIAGGLMKKLQFRDIFAFGPFIALSLVVYLFFGPDLIGWYLNLYK